MSSNASTQRHKYVFVTLGLILLTLLVFWPIVSLPFINYDDRDYVLDNAHVTTGLTWPNLVWAFGGYHSGNWHPLTWLSHALDCQLYGLNPWGHHLTNLVLHTVNVLLVFTLFQRMTGAFWRSAIVAALFAVHPLRVESVAWVADRKDLLAALFWLLSLGCYVSYASGENKSEGRNPTRCDGATARREAEHVPVGQNPKSEIRTSPSVNRNLSALPQHATRNTQHDSRFTYHISRYYLLSLAFFLLGNMSKGSVVTLPFVLLLLDYWPLGRAAEREVLNADRTRNLWSRWAPLFLEKLPFFAIAAVLTIIGYISQNTRGEVAYLDELPMKWRIGNALISYARYLGNTVWPARLCVYYPHPGIWPVASIAGAAVLLGALTALIVWQRRKRPYLLIGWLWFIGVLFPVIELSRLGSHAMADRYTYIPLMGLFLMLVWGAADLLTRWNFPASVKSAAAAAILVACMITSSSYLRYWQSTVILFRRAIAVTGENAVSQHIVAQALVEQGRLDEAMPHFNEALRIWPGYMDAHYTFANALALQSRFDEAIEHYRTVERHAGHTPLAPQVQFNLGNALALQGKLDEADTHFREALRLNPDFADAHKSYGTLLLMRGEMSEAIRQFSEEVRLNPDSAEARARLADAQARANGINHK